MTLSASIVGVLLAGGRAQRMGGDKGRRMLGGRTLLDRAIERARPQVLALALNVHDDPDRFGNLDLPVVTDSIPNHAGPLAGILAGMDWARSLDARWLASFPIDAPFFPSDLVSRLAEAVIKDTAEIAYAASGRRTHPVFGLWRVSLAEELRRALTIEGVRKVDAWSARHRVSVVTFDSAPADPFLNVNTPEDLAAAERLLVS